MVFRHQLGGSVDVGCREQIIWSPYLALRVIRLEIMPSTLILFGKRAIFAKSLERCTHPQYRSQGTLPT